VKTLSKIEKAIQTDETIKITSKKNYKSIHESDYSLIFKALCEQQEREKGCEQCESNCHNCKPTAIRTKRKAGAIKPRLI